MDHHDSQFYAPSRQPQKTLVSPPGFRRLEARRHGSVRQHGGQRAERGRTRRLAWPAAQPVPTRRGRIETVIRRFHHQTHSRPATAAPPKGGSCGGRTRIVAERSPEASPKAAFEGSDRSKAACCGDELEASVLAALRKAGEHCPRRLESLLPQPAHRRHAMARLEADLERSGGQSALPLKVGQRQGQMEVSPHPFGQTIQSRRFDGLRPRDAFKALKGFGNQEQGGQLGRAGSRPEVHAAGRQRRRRALTVCRQDAGPAAQPNLGFGCGRPAAAGARDGPAAGMSASTGWPISCRRRGSTGNAITGCLRRITS